MDAWVLRENPRGGRAADQRADVGVALGQQTDESGADRAGCALTRTVFRSVVWVVMGCSDMAVTFRR